MNNNTILVKKPLKKVLISTFTMVFGKLHWTCPPWLNFLRQTAINRPKKFSSIILLIFTITIGLGYAYHWYIHLPQPQLITASITAPHSTPITDPMVPDNLVIDFGINPNSNHDNTGIKANKLIPRSVAPLNLINKEVPNITLVPAIKGKWLWVTDSRLVFTPSEDWPAGQTYEIKFFQDCFTPNTKMKSLTYHFSTESFTANISELIFYQDPINIKRKQAVATIKFNFPVDPKSFVSNTSLILQELKNDKLDLAAHQFKFAITYDKYKRVAYLHSETLAIPKISRFVVLRIDKGVASSTGSAKTNTIVTKNLLIPDISSYFKVTTARASIIRNDQDRPEQILNLETTLGITEQDLKQSLHAYLLPQNYPETAFEGEKINYRWLNPGEVTASILALSTPLALQSMPTDRNYATLHSYKFNATSPRYIFLKLDKGIRGFGDFVLTNNFETIIEVPELPKEITFLHKGALLALSREKKLSVLVRGLPAVKFDIAHVLPNNINQLVTQTQGDFNNPYFINGNFNQQNISDISSEIQQFNTADLAKQNYTALDLTKYLSSTQGKINGLFLLQATGWDIAHNVSLDVTAKRFILVTDLGLLVKNNQDGSHEVFVQSITKGMPVANVEVSILGKNGLPILTQSTDLEGKAHFPTLTDFIDDKEPTVYLARLGEDLSFIPYSKVNRQLNLSRFDIGGLYTNQEQNHLSAFLFSDRNIYRPGDIAHIGMIVKKTYATPLASDLPLQAIITDPRGTTVYDKTQTLDKTGYLTIDFNTNASSPTGQYVVSLYTVKDDHSDNLLGSTTIQVAEFQPDRMRISSQLSQTKAIGWHSPIGLSAKVNLWNLYGAPATTRRISTTLLLSPQLVAFSKYPDYNFFDPHRDPNKLPKTITETLPDVKTNTNGSAQINLNLEKYAKSTYQLTIFVEGFEAEAGRSVTTQSTTLISDLPYFIGYKPDGDLNYIKQNSRRSVHLIAVNPQLNQQTIGDLKIQLLSLHPVTTLVKKDNGTYQYQSIIQSTVLNTKPLLITDTGIDYPLPTNTIGDFALSILDNTNTELTRIPFSVVGNSQLPLSKNAELQIKLNKTEYHAGDDIELQITAPYTGSGLITIERDKVYATQWFKTDTTNSVQSIHIPNDFQGNGYVNVAFVRDWNSPDVVISPLSYSVVPFTINNDNRAIHINLDVPKLARPGHAFTINYHSDKPGKIIVFAVDEGILQVSNYKTPNPLTFFFQKQALEVLTEQTLDQILPNYIKARERSSAGGDGSNALILNHLNPFKRKVELPVVYWSGIINTDITSRKLVYQIPDYFNGTLRVMAVAVSDDAVGSAEKKSIIADNFVINPNVPTFVAPGDEFDVTASVANNMKDSGSNVPILIQLKATPELDILDATTKLLTISQKHEQTVHFKLHANAKLGSAKLIFTASLADQSGHNNYSSHTNASSSVGTSLSVRPASTFMTSITSDNTQDATTILPITRVLYPEYRHVDVAISSNPLILILGLQRYIDNITYACTEQLVSQSMLQLAMLQSATNQRALPNDITKSRSSISNAIEMLNQRQMSTGGFSYWPNTGKTFKDNIQDNANNTLASVYAMHFLTEAKAAGYTIPRNLLYAGIAYLKDLATQTPQNLEDARLHAYAIYILTRNEMITTNYLTNLQLYLEQNKTNTWKQDITSAYIAATYQLLKNQKDALSLIDNYKLHVKPSVISDSSDFDTNTIADAQYFYLVARHFPNYLPNVENKLLISLVQAINSDDMNTLLASYTSLALSAYAQMTQQTDNYDNVSISETLTDNTKQSLTSQADYSKHTQNNLDRTIAVDLNAKNLILNNPDRQSLFYQLIEAGFDQKPLPNIKQGIEIFREYRLQDNVITSTTLGKDIEVHIQVRALDKQYLSNIAIVDLLPGGFEIIANSIKTDDMDYIDIRDDRVIFFTNLTSTAKEIVYHIKATTCGKFSVPPIFAESMYHPNIKAQNGEMTITVNDTLRD